MAPTALEQILPLLRAASRQMDQLVHRADRCTICDVSSDADNREFSYHFLGYKHNITLRVLHVLGPRQGSRQDTPVRRPDGLLHRHSWNSSDHLHC